MPTFEHGRIWLECQGKEMEEYDVRCEADKEGKPVKTSYVEAVPGANFVVHWSFDAIGAKVDGCNFNVSADGQVCDSLFVALQGGYGQGCIEGFRISPDTIVPYAFEPCRLADTSSIKGDSDSATLLANLKPYQRIAGPPKAAAASQDRRREAPVQTTYNTDSKPAVLGYSVGYGAERKGVKGAMFYDDYRFLASPDPLSLSFKYRTRDQLIARGLMQEERPFGSHADEKEKQSAAQYKEERTANAELALKRIRELEDELSALRQQYSAAPESKEDVKPKRQRLDAPSPSGAENRLKLSVDLTGEEDEK